jgi:hypothetical protein
MRNANEISFTAINGRLEPIASIMREERKND